MPPTSAINNGASSSGASATFHPPNGNGNGSPYNSYAHDDTDELDLLGDDPHHDDDETAAILDNDPLQTDLSSPFSFKRKQKQPGSGFLSQPSRLLSALSSPFASRTSHDNIPPAQPLNPLPPHPHAPTRSKDFPPGGTGLGPDYHAEGPGRRVAYEDLTAIDWIFEYTKERQRQRALHSTATTSALHPSSTLPALLSYIRRLLDASQVWIVLILSGLAVGALAAAIDVATDWLGDFKYGFCSSVDGGRFYLSKTACCYGYDEKGLCAGWKSWGDVLLGREEGGAVWAVEGVVYLVLAVGEI
jgi:chloride channel 3/4/5